MGLSNLPPGVTDSMIPGNRPEDADRRGICVDAGRVTVTIT